MWVYIAHVIVACFLLHIYKKDSVIDRKLVLGICVILWTLIAGGQYYIGSDYPAYLNYFTQSYNTDERFEPLFSFLRNILLAIGVRGQGPFFFFAALNIILIFTAAKRMGMQYYALLYFLVVVFSTFFNNQMNLVRQAGACALIFLAIACIEKRWLSIVCIILASGFHYSALLFLPMVVFPRLVNIITSVPKLLLLASTIFALITLPEGFINKYLFLIINWLGSDTLYANFYESDYSYQNLSFAIKATKLISVPFMYYSIIQLQRGALSAKEEELYRIGLLSFCLWIITMNIPVVRRLSYYFLLPSIIPIYYMISKSRSRIDKLISYTFVITYALIYTYKIYVGINEYAATFIYF